VPELTDLLSAIRVGVGPQGTLVPLWQDLMFLMLLLFLCPASERRRKGYAWSGEVGREHSSRRSPGCPLRFLFLHLLLRMSTAPILGGMEFFSFRQPAVAARYGGRRIPLLGALLVQVTAPAPQAAGRLFMWPNCWQLWHCVKTILGSICLYPAFDVAEAWETENFLGVFRPRQDY
jgi:hypothetical protein